MKKILAVLLALIMLLSLAGCGGKQDISGSVTFDDNKETVTDSTEEESEDEFEIGVTTGGTYENAFIGFGLKIPDDWMFYSEEQINQLNGLVADMVDDEQLKEQLKNAKTIYDMYAISADGLQTINVTMENLGVAYGKMVSEDDYIDIALRTLPSQLVSAGYDEDMEIEKVTVDFAGEQRSAIKIKAAVYGSEVYQMMVVMKAGNYMALTTSTSFLADDTAEIAGWFYAVD